MTNHIDLGTVLRQTLAANLYSNLVTRSTGAAVRTQIENDPGGSTASSLRPEPRVSHQRGWS